MRARAACLALPLLAAALACDNPPSDPSGVVAAYVGNAPLYRSDVERYFESNLVEVEQEEDLPPETIDEVKSRLLDALIEERILYAEAERRGIGVSAKEVAAYLDMGAADAADDAARRSWREVEARQRLMIQKLQEQVIREQPEPTDDEIAVYAEAHRAELIPNRPLELRALELPTPEEAMRIQREIRAGRMTFNEAALAFEASPGQSEPQRMSWETLPDDVRSALENLSPGDVSKPLVLHGSVYLFQIGNWLEDPTDQDVELMHRAMQRIESERHREALDGLLRELRGRTTVRLRESDLPFRYVPPSG